MRGQRLIWLAAPSMVPTRSPLLPNGCGLATPDGESSQMQTAGSTGAVVRGEGTPQSLGQGPGSSPTAGLQGLGPQLTWGDLDPEAGN